MAYLIAHGNGALGVGDGDHICG